MFMRVLLPEPEGPIKATYSPFSIDKETSFKAAINCEPMTYSFFMCFISITGTYGKLDSFLTTGNQQLSTGLLLYHLRHFKIITIALGGVLKRLFFTYHIIDLILAQHILLIRHINKRFNPIHIHFFQLGDHIQNFLQVALNSFLALLVKFKFTKLCQTVYQLIVDFHRVLF